MVAASSKTEDLKALETISFAEAAKAIKMSRSTIRRWAMDPDYPDLNAVQLPGMRPRLRLSEFVEWAKGR